MDNSDGGSVVGGILVFLLWVALYAYIAYSLQVMAKKAGLENTWMAWIPILNVVLMLQLAGKPLWWIILLLIPFLNIVIAIIVWIDIAKRMGKSAGLGVLVAILPIFIGLLAFSDSPVATAPVSVTPPSNNPPTTPANQ
jgi:hypothetical protein